MTTTLNNTSDEALGYFENLLKQYKKIYFDEQYYLQQRAVAYQTRGKKAPEVSDAWEDFATKGYCFDHGDGTYGINPSEYFDVKRYYREYDVAFTEIDPITDYTQWIFNQYTLEDPTQIRMPITPKRVGLGMVGISNGQASSSPPLQHIPKANDGFTNGIQYWESLTNQINWNYISLNQGNTIYYSFDSEDNTTLAAKELFARHEGINTYGSLDSKYYRYVSTIFSMLTSITGIIFEKIDDVNKSNIHFFKGEENTRWLGYTVSHSDYPGAYILINTDTINKNDNYPNHNIFHTIAHEIGHALGLQHPSDATDATPKEFNNLDYTIMAGETDFGSVFLHGSHSIVYGPRDILALQYLYGTDGLCRYSTDGTLEGVEGLVYYDASKPLEGTGGNDTLLGSDKWLLFGGKDTLLGGAGNDWLEGGSGDDSLDGGPGNDYLDGGDGQDTLIAGADGAHDAGNDTLKGGKGKDSFIVYNGGGTTRIEDATTDDTLRLASIFFPNLTAREQDGNLVLEVSDKMLNTPVQTIILEGWSGRTNRLKKAVLMDGVTVDLEAALAGSGTPIDTLPSDQTLTGTDAPNTFEIPADSGHTQIVGALSDDVIKLLNCPNPASSIAVRRNGDDLQLSGRSVGGFQLVTVQKNFDKTHTQGNPLNTVILDDGNTPNTLILVGDDDKDTLQGGAGNDALYGFGGDDVIYGGDGNDVLYGGDGDDFLHVLNGNDTLYGGAGSDTFYFCDSWSGHSIILDAQFEDILSVSLETAGFPAATLNGDDLVLRVGAEMSVTLQGWRIKQDRLAEVSLSYEVQYKSLGQQTITLEGLLAGNAVGTNGDDSLFGFDGNDRIYGAAGNDTLTGGWGDDYLDGGDGDDTLYGGYGDDTLKGGDGNDSLDGGDGNGNDLLYGGVGDDTLYGGAGNDTLYGEDGDDLLIGGDGDATLYGGDGDDTLYGGSTYGYGTVRLEGGAGNDALYSGRGNDTLDGGDGSDTLDGGGGNDILYGGAGDDLLEGGDGDDYLDGGDGDDTLYGNWGSNTLNGGTGNDLLYGCAENMLNGYDGKNTLCGDAGDDTLYGGKDSDALDGGADNDILYGGAGDDTLRGGDGDDLLYGDTSDSDYYRDHRTNSYDDTLYGGAGNDTLYGENGNDLLIGGDGDDLLDGGYGTDTLTGGAGADTFFCFSDTYEDYLITDATSVDTLHLDVSADLVSKYLRATLRGNDLELDLGQGSGLGRLTLTLQDWKTRQDRLVVATLKDGAKVNLSELAGLDGGNSGGSGGAGTGGNTGGNTQPGGDNGGGSGTGAQPGNGEQGGGNDTLPGSDIITRPAEAELFSNPPGQPGKSQTAKTGVPLKGTNDNDTLRGGRGADVLKGKGGHDRLIGGKGNDKLLGASGNDWLEGGAGGDLLKGGAGNDWLSGGKGNDVLKGGAGNDTLSGGAGKDRLSGGAGADVFLFYTRAKKNSVDTITDFKSGQGDRIALKRSLFSRLDMGQLSADNFTANKQGKAKDDNDFIIYNTKTGALLYDRDGKGGAAAVQIATLKGKPKLSASDIFVVK